jgi:hypothetical protein
MNQIELDEIRRKQIEYANKINSMGYYTNSWFDKFRYFINNLFKRRVL